LAEHQADPGRRVRAGIRIRVVPECLQPAVRRESKHRGRRAFAEAPQILAEPGLDRSRRAALESLDEASHEPEPVLVGEPWVAFAELRGADGPDVARRDAQRGRATGLGREPARERHGVEHREPKRGEDRRGPELAFDPLKDGPEPDELSRRVEVQELLGQVVGAVDVGEAAADRGADRIRADICLDALEVLRIQRGLALFGPALLIAADRAAVVPGDRSCPARHPNLVVDRPQDLVGDEHATASRAAGRIEVTERHLEAGIAAR
jgi:hypothetical protein